MTGKHIVIDGPPGSGKTTQIALLRDRLQAEGLPVLVLSDANAQNLNYDFRNSPRLKMLSVAVAYSQLAQKVQAMKGQGAICLVDRSHLGVMADLYYGHDETVDYETLNRVAGFATSEIEPDIVIVLDASVASLRQRMAADTEKNTDSDEAFLGQVRKGYLWEAQQRHYPIVSAIGTPEQTSRKIWEIVERYIPSKTKPGTLRSEEPVSVGQILKEKKLDSPKPPAPKIQDNGIVMELNISSLLAYRICSFTNAEIQPISGKIKYYIPSGLDKKSAQNYKKSVDKILAIRTNIGSKLKTKGKSSDALRAVLEPMLPLSTEVRVVIKSASEQVLASMARQLIADSLPEARLIGERILDRLGVGTKDRPKHNAKPPKTIEYGLVGTNSSDDNPAQLVDYWPKNEFELLPDLLYSSSGLSLQELKASIGRWTYARKAKILESALGGNQLLQVRAHFVWDILCDQVTARRLVQSLPGSLLSQVLTPRFGYDTPGLVESAGCSDMFDESFDESLSLYSNLQSAGFEVEAQYATLLGHKNHCRLTHDMVQLVNIFRLVTKTVNPELKQLARSMSMYLENIYPVTMMSLTKLRHQDKN